MFFFLPFAPLQIRQIIGELCDRLYEAQYGAEAEEKRFTLAQFYVSGIITRRHSILGDSPNKNREDLILVGFYVGGLFYSEVVKISKVLE